MAGFSLTSFSYLRPQGGGLPGLAPSLTLSGLAVQLGLARPGLQGRALFDSIRARVVQPSVRERLQSLGYDRGTLETLDHFGRGRLELAEEDLRALLARDVIRSTGQTKTVTGPDTFGLSPALDLPWGDGGDTGRRPHWWTPVPWWNPLRGVVDPDLRESILWCGGGRGTGSTVAVDPSGGESIERKGGRPGNRRIPGADMAAAGKNGGSDAAPADPTKRALGDLWRSVTQKGADVHRSLGRVEALLRLPEKGLTEQGLSLRLDTLGGLMDTLGAVVNQALRKNGGRLATQLIRLIEAMRGIERINYWVSYLQLEAQRRAQGGVKSFVMVEARGAWGEIAQRAAGLSNQAHALVKFMTLCLERTRLIKLAETAHKTGSPKSLDALASSLPAMGAEVARIVEELKKPFSSERRAGLVKAAGPLLRVLDPQGDGESLMGLLEGEQSDGPTLRRLTDRERLAVLAHAYRMVGQIKKKPDVAMKSQPLDPQRVSFKNLDSGVTGLPGLILRLVSDTKKIEGDEAAENFRRLLSGELGSFRGPVAGAIASVKSDWSKLLGIPLDPSKHELVPLIIQEGTHYHVTKVVLYENGQPKLALFPVWKSMGAGQPEVPILFRLSMGEVEKAGRQVQLQILNPDGSDTAVKVKSRDVAISERRFAEARFFEGEEIELRVGILESRGKGSIAVVGSQGEGLLLATPQFRTEDPQALVQDFEDLVGMAPHLTGYLRNLVEGQIEEIFTQAARGGPDAPLRRKLIERILTSHYPMSSRLLGFLRRAGADSDDVRHLASEIEFLLPIVGTGRKVTDARVISENTRSALVLHPSSKRRTLFVHHVSSTRDISDELHEAIGAFGTEAVRLDVKDGVINIVISEKSLSARTLQGQAAYLEEAVNKVLKRRNVRPVKDFIWRITFTIDRGEARKASYVTVRNRFRYEEEWQKRNGYHIDLPGRRLFVADPSVLGIDPLRENLYGLKRLGEYRSIEVLEAHDPEAGVVFLLGGQSGPHLYLSSVLDPGEGAVNGKGRMPGLIAVHRRLVAELRRQLGDQTRWPKGEGAPDWNRLRFYLQGIQEVSPQAYEEQMALFAEETMGDRLGLDLERVVVEGKIRFVTPGGAKPVEVTAITTIEDIGEVADVWVRYITRAQIQGVEQEVLVDRAVLERILTTGNNEVGEGEWKPADEKIRDKTPNDRRRDVALKGGGTFIYHRVYKFLPAAVEAFWRESGKELPPGPLVEVDEIFVEGGQFRVGKREPGKNAVGAAAFRMKVKLPNCPEGRTFVVVGNDPTHRSTPAGAFSFDVGKFIWLAGEYARQQGFGFVYLPHTSGAQMGLPDEIIPRKAGMPLRLHWDKERSKIYLTEREVKDVVAAMKAKDWQEVFAGEWATVGREKRLYTTAILKGGVNQKSLQGSGLAGGTMARLATSVPTMSLLLGGRGRGNARAMAVGIGYYLWWLARGMRGQQEGSAGFLTGDDPMARMFRLRLFEDLEDLGGTGRLHREGAATHVFKTEMGGLDAMLEVLNQPEAPIPGIEKIQDYDLLRDISPTRVATGDTAERDIGPDIQASIDRVTAERVAAREKGSNVPPNDAHHYDAADELAALVDRGTFRRVEGTAHHAILGTGRLNGCPVAVVGAQMLAEFALDQGGKIILDEVDAFERDASGAMKKVRRKKPRVNPPMTLTPEAAGDLATFIENLTRVAPWMPIVGDLGASGYDPISVVKSGRNGARLLSAIANHTAPVLLWAGPGKKIFGGMKVTVARELGMTAKIQLDDGAGIDFDDLGSMADPGHIRAFADPGSFEAVLDPPAWQGIGFYKTTVTNVARLLRGEDSKLPEKDAEGIATQMVDQVIAQMSTIRRAEVDGAFTAVIGADRIRETMVGEIDTWYQSDGFRALAGP